MKKILMFTPSLGSINIGDQIIYEGIRMQLRDFTKDAFIAEFSTHTPLSKYLKNFSDFDLRFICGSNLLMGKMNGSFRQWDIKISDLIFMKPVILIGVGWWQYGSEFNWYSKFLLKHLLSKDYIHSVRDSFTEKKLKEIGINNVINTSCPTMWGLTIEHCSKIKQEKSLDVVCTLTDYNREPLKDLEMLEILSRQYRNVFFWIQGSGDLDYLNLLNKDNKIKNIILVPPTLDEYNKVLTKEVDYIGTRLHAGIRALQMKRRSIIIAIDNRAIEKQKDFNIVCISRNNVNNLEKIINSSFPTEIRIPQENICKWKSQFGLGEKSNDSK